MNQIYKTFIPALIFALIVVVASSFYVVDETHQVVITQFGEPIGEPIDKAGLHMKIPFIQNVNRFENRILNWDGDPNQIPTRDKRYIWVDTTARWQIVDALTFMESVGNESSAQARLDDIIDAATRDAIANLNLVEAVRNSNRLVEEYKNMEKSDDNIDFIGTALDEITVGRELLTRAIIEESQKIISSYGIRLIDVRIKRINYLDEVQQKVYERMISERKRVAVKIRSEGQGKKAEIEGQMIKELDSIRSQAYKIAQELQGKADAKAVKIYGDAYNQDPDFYAFVETLDSYRDTITDKATLLLTTDSEFLKYLETTID